MTVIVALALYTLWTLGAMVMLVVDACLALMLAYRYRHTDLGRSVNFRYWFKIVRRL